MLLLAACGRKNHAFFSFKQPQQVSQFNMFAFPWVRLAKVSATESGRLVEWEPLEHAQLIGYHLYRVSSIGVVAKKPCIFLPASKHSYNDIASMEAYSYVIRAVFLIDGKQYEGLASKIIR